MWVPGAQWYCEGGKGYWHPAWLAKFAAVDTPYLLLTFKVYTSP